MNSSSNFLVEDIWAEIRTAYNVTFLEKLLEIQGIHVYAFGGIVTDTALGKAWKDLDLRIIWDVPTEKQLSTIVPILKEHTTIIQQVQFPGGLLIRVKVPGGKDMIIDIGVTNNFAKFRADFKACAIFIDLKTGEVVELGESCVDDFKNKIIRPLDEPLQQLENDPSHLFRALKFAAKTGFVIDPQFEKILKEKKTLAQRAVKDVIVYLQKNGKDSIAEYFLGNIFGGLKADAVTYIRLLTEYGFLEEMCQTVQRLVCGGNTGIVVTDNSKSLEGIVILEDKLSLFLSSIAKSISDNPSLCFESIKKAFALDTSRSDGNEFVVDPAKIVFVP